MEGKENHESICQEKLQSDSGVALAKVVHKPEHAQTEASKKDGARSVPTRTQVKVQSAWTPLQVPPCGSVHFQEIWETTWDGRGESEYLSDVMARCIENCRLSEIDVPEAFRESKREAEQREYQEEVGPYLNASHGD